LNPRRPTPSGPKPETPLPASSPDNNRFPSNGGSKGRKKDLESFLRWCLRRGTSRETCEQYVRYLKKPLDMSNKWSRLAWKAYYKFIGDEKAWSSIKVKQSGIDLKVPSTDEVLRTLRAACETSEELCIIYKLLIESGARLREVVKALNDFDSSRLKRHDGFYTYVLGYFRGSKRAFYLFTITEPRRLVCSDNWVSNWASKHGMVQPKYIRKFVATAMASLGIPETVINFIQGRTPKQVLERNYLSLYSLALKYYPKYAEWLKSILKNI